MELLIITCLCISVFIQVNGQPGPVDPCESGSATILRNQYRRSINYTAGDDGEPEEDYVSDRYLETGWYIFEGYQGQEMPTSPQMRNQCGTKYPIWLDGTLPTVTEGIADRTACSVGLSTTCDVGYFIKVKNCGEGTYAYHLIPTSSHGDAYCIGDQIPCPEGQSSANGGFTPGCTNEGFPVFMNRPEISYKVDFLPPNDVQTRYREVVMLCDITHNETDIEVDVEWYMKGSQVFTQTVEYGNLPAELHEADWFNTSKLDVELICEVKPRYTGSTIPGPIEKSDGFYMGFTVDNLVLTVEEKGDPSYYTFRPTIPILCPDVEEGCTLSIAVQEPYIPIVNKPPSCPDGRRLKQLAIKFEETKCTLEIPMTETIDENTAFSLEVRAATEGSYDGNHEVALMVRSAKTHIFHSIWQDYHLPVAQVSVVDKDDEIAGSYCKAYNDPHLRTFDGRFYDNQQEGEFIMYRHNILPIEVQTYFKMASNNVYSYVCGAAVRSGGDLYVYDKCNYGEAGRSKLYECDDLNMAIVKNGDTVEIELPTGTKVKIAPSSVIIYPSLQDLYNVGGLCGQFDLICGNDFLGGDDFQFEDPCVPGDDTYPCSELDTCNIRDRMHDFADTWRVLDGESLYEGEIRTPRPQPDEMYCSCVCQEDDVGEDVNCTTICQRSESLEFCIAGGESIGGGDWENECTGKSNLNNAGSDNVVDEVGPFEYDPDIESPIPQWKDPWDEPSARAECEKYIEQLQGLDTCVNIPNIDTTRAVEACIEDIKITGSTEFNAVHASGILSACLTEITKNMSFFNFNNDTGKVEPPNDMTKDICSTQCLNNGTCVNGACVCTDGYSGEDCFYDDNKVPMLYGIPQKGLCDTRNRACEQTPVTGNYFLEKDTLSCHIQPVLLTVSGDKISQDETKIKATFDHYERVMCPIPLVKTTNTDVFTTGYIVSVSNDGVTPSDTRNLVTYDSLCMQCTADLDCSQLAGTCFIDTSCYASGQSAPTDPCNVCDPDLTSSEWTPVTTGECNTDMSGGAIAGITILVVASAATVTMGTLFVMKKKKRTQVGDMSSEMETVSSDNLKQEEEKN